MTIEVEIILYICGAIITISGAAAIIMKLAKNSVAKVSKETYKQLKQEEDQKLIDEFKELSNRLDSFMEETRANITNQKEMVIALSCAKINESYDYFISKGEIGAYTLSVLQEVFDKYKQLGGNHLAERQMEELKKLPSSKSA